MRIPRKTILRSIAVALGLTLAAGFFVAVRSWSGRGQGNGEDSLQGWQEISGHWTQHAGEFSNSTYGRGDMLIAQHSQRANYTISADIRFNLLFSETHYGDAGLVIRTSDPEKGVDSYHGYYAGLRPDEQTLILGRASYDWHLLEIAKLASPIAAGAWYHLELSAQGCKLIVTAKPYGDLPSTRIEHVDNQCLTEGVAGLRSFYTQASWRNVQIAPQ